MLAHARELLVQLRPGWFTGGAGQPSAIDCQAIAAILRPKFEMYQSPAARAKLLQEELKTYTEEQTEFLDAMDTNQRLFVQGPAGTGKTLLAIESARRSVRAAPADGAVLLQPAARPPSGRRNTDAAGPDLREYPQAHVRCRRG